MMKKSKKLQKRELKNILNVISNECKIIMPSTHVIYEGLDQVEKNLKEDKPAKPILTYGKSKYLNEKQFKSPEKNVILRLGSVYGYTTDTARIDIMANYFAKVTSQNGVLRLFDGGKQIKKLSSFDRCRKML